MSLLQIIRDKDIYERVDLDSIIEDMSNYSFTDESDLFHLVHKLYEFCDLLGIKED